jgi:hypothetical protein
MTATEAYMAENRKIRHHFKPYNAKSQPSWLVHPERSSESPDMIIDYRE